MKKKEVKNFSDTHMSIRGNILFYERLIKEKGLSPTGSASKRLAHLKHIYGQRNNPFGLIDDGVGWWER
tara:strand:- start:3437 stop:3643 length:207 start_codon:yes stop_codon:yes gene_type:complete